MKIFPGKLVSLSTKYSYKYIHVNENLSMQISNMQYVASLKAAKLKKERKKCC